MNLQEEGIQEYDKDNSNNNVGGARFWTDQKQIGYDASKNINK